MSLEQSLIKGAELLHDDPDRVSVLFAMGLLLSSDNVLSVEYVGKGKSGHLYRALLVEPVTVVSSTQTITR